ncbi:MAG: hypothetical protein JOS17DRAFT_764148 [Linnemannia elongata]|nr:MAG: hypothetical protein JOS17DRAFT_764148 [Linnemannia elongata]
MTQDTENTDREGTLLQHNPSHRDQDDSDNNDDDEAFPPSYEEAISHFDDNNTAATSSTTAPQQQPVLSLPPLPQSLHSQQPSRHLQNNDDLLNEQQQQHSRQPTENRSTNNSIGLADSSAPLKPTHTPSAPPAAAPGSGDNNDSGGQDNSNAHPQLNPFGHTHIDPFHQHHHHQHPSSSTGSASPFPPMPQSSTVPGFGDAGRPPNMFGGLPPSSSFPFGHPPSMLPPGVVPGGGFPGLFQPPIPPVPPGMFGIPGQGGFPPLAGFAGFPSLGRPPVEHGFSFSTPPGSRPDGKGSFSFGGPSGGQTGNDSTTPSSSRSGFSFGQTEAATTDSPRGSSPSSGRGFPMPRVPPAPPVIPGLPSMSPMPPMPPMPPAHTSSPPDVPAVLELPGLPSSPKASASIPSNTAPTSGAGAGVGAGQGAEPLPPSFFMATTTSESRPVPPSGIPSLEGAPTGSDISTATYKRTDRGVETQDLLLDDPFQLYRFFVAHNDKPQMHVLITGSHVEKKSTEKRAGDGTISTVHSKVKVCDFKIDLDLTSYISPYGTIKTLPDPKTSNKLSLREVIEQHVTEENPFKEMHMKKKVSWDYEDLTRAIVHAIRSVNYRYKIEISYPTSNNRVIVHSASPLAQFMRSTWTKAFCGISLVGIVLYPLREYYKVVKDKNIQSEFHMTISTADFMRNNYWKIVDQVQFKNE